MLLIHLEKAPLYMVLQGINRPNLHFRDFAGQIGTGTVKPGDAIPVLPFGKITHVKSIVTFDSDPALSMAGRSITLIFADEVDCSRGDADLDGQARNAARPPFLLKIGTALLRNARERQGTPFPVNIIPHR